MIVWQTQSAKLSAKNLFRRKRLPNSFSAKNFCEKNSIVVDSYTQEFFSQNYPSLIEALPTNLREPVLDAISTLQLKIGEHIQTVLKSEETVESISGFVERRVDEFLSKRVSEVVDEEQFTQILNFLETRIKSAVKEPALEKKIADFITNKLILWQLCRRLWAKCSRLKPLNF